MSIPVERVERYIEAREHNRIASPTIDMYHAGGNKDIARLNIDDLKHLVEVERKHARLIAQSAKLLAALAEHKELEGVDIEIKTREGWIDGIDLASPMVRNF